MSTPSGLGPSTTPDRTGLPLVVEVPPIPSGCAELRVRLRDWVNGIDCSRAAGDAAVLAVDEVLGMVIQYAERGARAGSVRVSVALVHDAEGRRRIAVGVRNFGRWRLVEVEPVDDPHRLAIIHGSVDRVDFGADGDGTRITMLSPPIDVPAPADEAPWWR